VALRWPRPLLPGAEELQAVARRGDATLGGSGIADRESAKNWLIANGVTFNGAASAITLSRAAPDRAQYAGSTRFGGQHHFGGRKLRFHPKFEIESSLSRSSRTI